MYFLKILYTNVRVKKTSNEKLKGLKNTIYTCIDNGILKDFPEHHKREVETMLMTVFSPEQALEFIKLEEFNKGIEQGIEQGKHDAGLNFARNMLKNNFSIDSIMKVTGLSREEIESCN